MEASELIKRFDDSRVGDPLTRKAFLLLVDSSMKSAAQFLDCVEGMSTYNNYVSEAEAVSTVEKLQNADGTTGAKWNPDTLFNKVQSLGGEIEHAPKYNKWALYLTMNAVSSDHSAFVQKYAEGDSDQYALMCYELAVDKLTDKDKPCLVRWYFNL